MGNGMSFKAGRDMPPGMQEKMALQYVNQMVNTTHQSGPETNGDVIRKIGTLPDDQLAVMLLKVESLADDYCKNLPECAERLNSGVDIPEEECRQCLIAWLGQPAKV